MSGSTQSSVLKVFIVVGTRPEAIKMAPVIHALRRDSAHFSVTVCATQQHGPMLFEALGMFAITPDVTLDALIPGQSLTSLTARLMQQLETAILDDTPDWVLAQGDTASVMAAGLVSFLNKIPFGHVEAGLRSGRKFEPFPEEINRRVADVVADVFFAPTDEAKANLLREGTESEQIVVTGNTVVDALLAICEKPYDWKSGALKNVPEDSKVALITMHRRENMGEPVQRIITALDRLAEEYPDVHFVLPVHPNPNVREPVTRLLAARKNIALVDPLPYIDLVQLMRRSSIILTDSGGIQEEAPTFNVPVLVLRETTERPEAVKTGHAILVGSDTELILAEARKRLSSSPKDQAVSTFSNPFGDGNAAERIAGWLTANGRIISPSA